MSLNESGISWTDGTLNSLYGCRECSVGCLNCYAVGRVYRHSKNPKVNADGRFNDLVAEVKNEQDDDTKRQFTGAILFDPAHLYAVLNDSEPKRIFVTNSLTCSLHPCRQSWSWNTFACSNTHNATSSRS